MICSGVCRRLAIVMILPSPTIVGNGLSSRVDRSHGVRPYVVAHRFRGLLIRSRVARGLFWNTLTASEQEIRLGRWPLEPVLVAREMTAAVRFQKVSLPLWWGTDVMFETSGLRKRYVFVPFRPQQLRDCLQSLGWRLVEADDVNLRQLVRRLRP